VEVVMRGSVRVVGVLAAVGVICAAGVAGFGRAVGAGPSGRVESAVTGSTSGDGVRESYVSVSAPLPASAGAHPAVCDRLGYLRVRAIGGPDDPARADTVFVTMPGILAGSGSLEPTARNIVRAAAEGGRHVEVWVMDRRANCLEDHRGLAVGAAQNNPALAFDYYFGTRVIDGHRYQPAAATDTGFLRHVGLAQTLQDYRTILGLLPDSVRRSKVMCGGHSLGGLITGALADWDFDGTPGYSLCAGFFTLDSRLKMQLVGPLTAPLTNGLAQLQRLLPITLPTSVSDLLGTALPYINIAPLTPETLTMAEVFSQAAAIAPEEPSTLLARVPHDVNFELLTRLLAARDPIGFALGQPDVRRIHATYAAALGLVIDDNTEPIGILRASLGALTGGPVVRKNFPLPYGTPLDPLALLGGDKLVSPAAPNTLYRWHDYNALTPADTRTADGDTYTNPSREVTDLHQFAAAYSAPVADGTEWYFPTRLLTDVLTANLGNRQGDLHNLRYDNGVTQRPAINLDGGDTGFGPSIDPTNQGPGTIVVLPGYNHLDVGTAAWHQNNNQPEPLSHTLVNFAAQHTH